MKRLPFDRKDNACTALRRKMIADTGGLIDWMVEIIIATTIIMTPIIVIASPQDGHHDLVS